MILSDKLVPDTEPDTTGDVPDSEKQLIDVDHDLEFAASVNLDNQENTSKEKPKIKVAWTNLLTGDVYSSQSQCTIPTCVRGDQIHLIERDHVLNDTVRHAKRDIVGKIVNMRTKACGEVLSYGRVLLDLDCRRLRSVYSNLPLSDVLSQVVYHAHPSFGSNILRLLVREEGLRHFEPVAPTSDAFPDTLFEGAWIQGEAHGLKSNSGPSGLSALFRLCSDRNRPTGSAHAIGIPNSQPDGTASSNPNVTSEPATRLAPKPDPARWYTTDEVYPPGHPLNLFRDLAQSSATRPLLHTLCGKDMRLLDRTPIFLTETKTRNALWLSRLSSFTHVTVFVERFLPAEATVHWFANRRAAVHSNNPVLSKPPPSVVLGEDLANLRPVIPYPYLSCTGSDIWYYQLDESDVMYDL
ncbi:unnamed protein product [Echinostoma caproni]|uniref:Snurportin-1 n=1 Tax=Echinostoma caproni TaxID=27848 RepID=A0A183AS03_9TREM|nr:unnamed protein product [Echinostoma caproni]